MSPVLAATTNDQRHSHPTSNGTSVTHTLPLPLLVLFLIVTHTHYHFSSTRCFDEINSKGPLDLDHKQYLSMNIPPALAPTTERVNTWRQVIKIVPKSGIKFYANDFFN